MSKQYETKQKIWIDLDNTPHVLFFDPIINDLKALGFEIFLTIRDAFQVREIADQKKLNYVMIGRHYGKNLFFKIFGLLRRAFQLVPYILREKPVLAISHGSRSQILTSRILGIPTLEFTDYEHAQSGGILTPTWIMAPEVLAGSHLTRDSKDSLYFYPGYKENVYVSLHRDSGLLSKSLGLYPSNIIVTVRPPADEAHYYDTASEDLFQCFMKLALSIDKVKIILLPRNRKQENKLTAAYSHWFTNNKIVVPEKPVEGIQLIAESDLVVSGGGTMIREAAVIGVPAYSIFGGKIGEVDHSLAKKGRLILVRNESDVKNLISFTKHKINSTLLSTENKTRKVIIDFIIERAQNY